MRAHSMDKTQSMRAIIISAALLACAVAIPAGGSSASSHQWFEFGKFVQQHGKTYASVEEFSARFAVFKNSMDLIETHNAKADRTYNLALNKFADLTWQEFKSMYLGYRHLSRAHADVPVHSPTPSQPNSVTTIDWRANGCVNAIQNQGQCGSCWAFSAVAALECANFLKSGALHKLSEQQIVDCATDASGCSGGYMQNAFDYVIKNKGIECAGDYPYNAQTGSCHADPSKPVCGTLSNYTKVAPNDAALQAAAVTGVVATAIYVGNDFYFYSSGVYDSPRCPTDAGNHGISVVGFDAAAPVPYYIVRNTWGDGWGEKGYIRMKMGKNLCGLATYAYTATA